LEKEGKLAKGKSHRLEMHGMEDITSEYKEFPSSGIVNLRFEDC